MSQLPDKLSDLITVALKDLAAVEADPRYTVDMWHWHLLINTTPQPDNAEPRPQCAVCLAGAVMAQTLGTPINKSVGLKEFKDRPTRMKLRALDYIRQGYIMDALEALEIERPRDVPDYVMVTPYSCSASQFRADLEAIATQLRAHGL